MASADVEEERAGRSLGQVDTLDCGNEMASMAGCEDYRCPNGQR